MSHISDVDNPPKHKTQHNLSWAQLGNTKLQVDRKIISLSASINYLITANTWRPEKLNQEAVDQSEAR